MKGCLLLASQNGVDIKDTGTAKLALLMPSSPISSELHWRNTEGTPIVHTRSLRLDEHLSKVGIFFRARNQGSTCMSATMSRLPVRLMSASDHVPTNFTCGGAQQRKASATFCDNISRKQGRDTFCFPHCSFSRLAPISIKTLGA